MALGGGGGSLLGFQSRVPDTYSSVSDWHLLLCEVVHL